MKVQTLQEELKSMKHIGNILTPELRDAVRT